ncbi:MAG: hypothetical protein Q8R53_00660 [Nanoarchaeota archaeon]|nr:hypothetical protein [Nanoarchaeota archaeon]
MFHILIWPFSSTKGKKALSEDEFKDRITDIQQKRKTTAVKASTKARKKERNVRQDLRKIARKVGQAAKILGRLQQAAAQRNAPLIKDSWRRGKAEIAKIEALKVEVGVYAALVAKLLGETADLTIPKELRDELKLYKGNLLRDVETLETHVASITKNVQMLSNKQSVPDYLWGSIASAVENASKTFQKILTDGEAGLAVEQRVREMLGKE